MGVRVNWAGVCRGSFATPRAVARPGDSPRPDVWAADLCVVLDAIIAQPCTTRDFVGGEGVRGESTKVSGHQAKKVVADDE